MEIEITKERENRLLHRTEIEGIVKFESGTPTRKDIIKYIAAKKNIPEKLVVVSKIDQEYGGRSAKVEIRIYESESKMKSIEPEYMIKRQEKGLKEAEKEEAKGEEQPGEKVKEGAKEEKKEGEEDGKGE